MSLKALMDLSGRAVLITGGSRGLGLQMAEALGEMGAKVAITARHADELEKAAKHLRSQGVQVLTVPGDLSNHSDIKVMADSVIESFGGIDILVNNAGTSWGAPAEDTPVSGWRKVMTLNVDALFFLTQYIAKNSMIPRKYGKIINTASIAGLKGSIYMQTIAYNTSKGAVVNLTRALAAEWGRYNINVNAICPGFFPSKMASGIIDKLGEKVIESTPLRRVGDDEDLKGLVALLASDASKHITGQAIAVDGGAAIA